MWRELMGPDRRRPAACALVLLLPLGGCATSEPGTTATQSVAPRAGGTVVLGSISDVDSWNEYLSQQSFAGNLLRRIYLRLAHEQASGPLAPDEAYEPQLAESWSFSPDGLALTFRLRESRWSDGAPVTADDVRFTWKAQTSPDVPWIAASTKERITDVEVVDPRTVTFHFANRYPYQFADAVEGGILPAHVFGKVDLRDWATHNWLAQAKIGSGPFIVAGHEPGHEIVLKRNPRYFRDGYPLVDEVIARIVPDSGNLLTQLLAGDLDYMEGITPRDAARIGTGQAVATIPFDYPQYDFIGWNGSRKPFDDPAIRRALTLAIDRDALVEQLLYGFGRVSHGPVLSFSWGADPELRPWPHDPDESRRLLADRGYATATAQGGSTPGRKLALELITNSGNQLREEMLVKIQEQLSRVGIEARVRPVEMRTLRHQVLSGDYDAYLGGWVYSGKIDLEPLFGSASAPPEGSNTVRYRSAEVDRRFEELSRATSAEEMLLILIAIQRRIHEDQPYTFLYETQRVAGHGSRLRGVRIDIPADPLARLESFWIAAP